MSDSRRFNTVDNQLFRIAEIVGDGIISGWEVTDAGFPFIEVSHGNGLIDRFYVETFDDKTIELSTNSSFFIFAQRRVGVIGTQSPKSNIVSLVYSDIVPPSTPTDFTASEIDPFNILLSWSSNNEPDLYNYELERGLNGIDYDVHYDVDKEATGFDDITEEETLYYYRLTAVDVSGNKSSYSYTTIQTSISTILPTNPIDVSLRASENSINILWLRPPTINISKISSWLISIFELDTDNSVISESGLDFNVAPDQFNYRIDNLENGKNYSIIIKTVDYKNRESTGVDITTTPLASNAPRDPINIEQTNLGNGTGVKVLLSWGSGDTPYDPAESYRYKIYIYINSNRESIPIDVPIGENSYTINLYSFDGIEYFNIPENALITTKITSVDNTGLESFGNYLRFVTGVFKKPNPIENIVAIFNFSDATIDVTWDNQPDTSSVKIIIIDDDLLDSYFSGIEIFNDNIGKVERHSFFAELNHRYTIYVIAVNLHGAEVDIPSAAVILTGSPERPELPVNLNTKVNDRQIRLTWDKSISLSARFYNIYQKSGEITFDESDWTLIDTVPSDVLYFVNYGLTNDQTYSYYITTVDVYGQESFHLEDGFINLNFIESEPRKEGILTEPTNVTTSFAGQEVLITWDSFIEEFDSFSVYRTTNNLHSWSVIATIDKNDTSYLDDSIELKNGNIFYYMIDKSVNDADIAIQTTSVSPENSIFLAKVISSASSFIIDSNGRRLIADMIDPIAEYTQELLLPHIHSGIGFNPSRIDLNPELIITDWTTVDGKTFVTKERDINGTNYIVKVNGRFPQVFFKINPSLRQLVFSEPIVEIDENGDVVGDFPVIEVRVLGIEEVQGILDAFRFDDLHARQIQFGTISHDQLPLINHEGRLKERLLPKRFLLEKFDNQTFIVPQNNTDTNKNFGDGTTFYSTIEFDGKIDELVDFDSYIDGTVVLFQNPAYDILTESNIDDIDNLVTVSSDPGGFQSEKSYKIEFRFIDNLETRWLKLVTTDTENKPNPILNLNKRLRFRIKTNNDIFICLGVREVNLSNASVGDNGGTTGPIEWVGVENTLVDEFGNITPIGRKVVSGEWQEVIFDFKHDRIINFENGNGSISTKFGVLEHLGITIDNTQINSELFEILLDEFEQFTDILVSGTSQGILISEDFGTTWELSRLTDTPVHKFYKANNNRYLWAISATEVLLSVDPAFWFATSGTVGIKYIRDITEDAEGDMYISTDKGVHYLRISTIQNFSSFRQTQPINAFTTDCYALYHNSLSSGVDEIWVSTELGVYITQDKGETWIDSQINTGGLVSYNIINIGTNAQPNLIAINRKHVLRMLYGENNFSVISDLENQHNIKDVWKMSYFSNRLYVSTEKGIFMNGEDALFTIGINEIPFVRVLSDVNNKYATKISFGLDSINEVDIGGRLFIGQENRLLSIDEFNTVRLRKEYLNKELPVFFSNDDEIIIGYIYNAFNNVVVFREPKQIGELISASYLPIKTYLATNGGWSNTNPSTSTFIYVNGIPKWLDFTFDETEILADLQVVQDQLNSLPELDSFNSLVPNSTSYLQKTLDAIAKIQSGGTDEVPLINNETIIEFLDNYSMFLHLISSDLQQNISSVRIIRTGIRRIDRQPGSKAEVLEQKYDFTAEESVGIIIDAATGEVNFQTAFSNATNPDDRDMFTFSKYDQLNISILNSNISNTGELSHTEIEDLMESNNTGLSSNLAKSVFTNMIRLGIGMERQNNFLFDLYKVSNIQSKFYSSDNNDWYDIINSTIDFSPIVSTQTNEDIRFANSIVLFDQDPYFINKVWVGTDSNIAQINFMENNFEIEKIVSLQQSKCYVISLLLLNDVVYAVIQNQDTNKFFLLSTFDYGSSWIEQERINLPNKFYSINILNGIKIMSTENGMFFCDNQFGLWSPSSLVISDSLSDDSPVIAAFRKTIINTNVTTFIIIESERWFYVSSNGVEFFAVGRITNNNVNSVNKIMRFKNLTWVATNRGLYIDSNTILSDSVQFSLQTTLEDTASLSASIEINDISHGQDAIYCASSTGNVYRYYDSGDGGEWKKYKVPDMDVIHKIIMLYPDDSYMMLFSYNKILVINTTIGSGVFDS